MLFDRGVAQFKLDNGAEAASDFFEAATRAPRAAAAWANAGTASWEVRDTARAVVGWQRALRLDPLDASVRRALTFVGADSGATARDVWPVPRRAPAWLALALWLGAWTALWYRGRFRWRRRSALVAVAAAVLLGVVSRAHVYRLVDPRVAVMADPAPLRLLPALGSEAGAMPRTGELLTVLEHSGVWVRVRAAGDREGWLDAARVLDRNARPLRE
jgi:hypothetical protein